MTDMNNYQTTEFLCNIKSGIPKAPIIRPIAHSYDDLPFLELPPLAQQLCDDPIVNKIDASEKLVNYIRKLQRK